MKPATPTMQAILRADRAEYLNAARNGQSGPRPRVRKPLRLPPETWERVESLADTLKGVFPERYITINSTIEFLLNEGFASIYALQGGTDVFCGGATDVPHDSDYSDIFEEE